MPHLSVGRLHAHPQIAVLTSQVLFLENENKALALRLQHMLSQLEESRAELRSAHLMHNALLSRIAPVAPSGVPAPQTWHQPDPLPHQGSMVRVCRGGGKDTINTVSQQATPTMLFPDVKGSLPAAGAVKPTALTLDEAPSFCDETHFSDLFFAVDEGLQC